MRSTFGIGVAGIGATDEQDVSCRGRRPSGRESISRAALERTETEKAKGVGYYLLLVRVVRLWPMMTERSGFDLVPRHSEAEHVGGIFTLI